MKTPGFTVLELATDEELLTVVGELVQVDIGETLKVTGQFVTHPTYGSQFKAAHCRAHPARHLWGDFKVPLLRGDQGDWPGPSPAAWWTPLGTRPWR